MSVVGRCPLVLVVVLGLQGSVLGATGPVDGLLEYLDGQRRAGQTEALEQVVRGLETHPTTEAARRELVRGLTDLLERHGETALLDRLERLPEPLSDEARKAFPPIAFPRDHGAHSDYFAEWWYFNGNLEAGGERYGYELTFFRTAIGLNFVHTAFSDISGKRHPFERKYLFESRTRAVESVMDLEFLGNVAHMDAEGRIHVAFVAGEERIALTLTPRRAPMFINGDGIIDMPEGLTSRYYSHTLLDTEGTWTHGDAEPVAVTGSSWFDHQWGHFIAFARPWDWFCFQMEDGSQYNLFHFRRALGFSGRTCVNKLDPEGNLVMSRQMTLSRQDWWQSEVSGRYFVTRWVLDLPELGERFEVTTPLDDQEMPRVGWFDWAPAYWEGAIDILRTDGDGQLTAGQGYCEHMPYRRPWPAGSSGVVTAGQPAFALR